MAKVKRDAFLYLEPRAGAGAAFAQCFTCRDWAADKRLCAILGPRFENVEGQDTCGAYIEGRYSGQPIVALTTPEAVGFIKSTKVRCENCEYGGADCGLYVQLNKALPDVFDLDTKIKPQGCCNAFISSGEAAKASAGTVRANLHSPQELRQLLRDPAVTQAMQRPPPPQSINPALVAGLRSGQVRVPGMTPQQIVMAKLTRARVTKALAEAKGMPYQDADDLGAIAEHEFVRRLGVKVKDFVKATKERSRGEAQRGASGVQSSGIENRPPVGNPQPGGGLGGGNPAGQPGGQAQEPPPQPGQGVTP